tara:strand:- start:2392 stop:2922 length:531 start_codon:yes stop_codon:yes gene_type:complete
MFKVIEDLSQFLLTHPTKTYAFRDTSTIDSIVVHQTAGSDQGKFTAYNIANDHVNNNDWAGIGYHYLITDDGKIYKTNPENKISYHASGWNTRSIGVSITGNHTLGQEIDSKKYNALVYLLAKLSNKYNISVNKIVGHNETGSPKSCPNLNMDQLRSDVKKKKFIFGSERVLSLAC